MHNVLTGGNWYRPKEWSQEAINTGLLIEVNHGDKQSLIVGYNTDEHTCRKESVKFEKTKDVVANDIWQLDIQPGRVKALASEAKDAYSQIMCRLMHNYGCKNILFIDYGRGQEVDGLMLDQGIIIGSERDIILLLVDDKIGMPTFEFLSWLKGDDSPHLRLTSEWSGIPTNEIDWAYERLIHFFRFCLREWNAEAK